MHIPTARGPRVLGLTILMALLLVPLAGPAAGLAAPGAQPAPGLPTDPVPDPHQPGVLWFAATGHTLRGSFLTYWNQYGGLAQFGYPITEEFQETATPTAHQPLMVQYFQRARFEHHPENTAQGTEVQLGLLGVAFHTPDPAVPAQANPASQYFPETGHNVSGLFLAYWKAHGGLFVNGYPISEQFQEVNPIDGHSYTVQYFQRERFELHPENAGTPYEVELGLLGTQLARQRGYFGGNAGTYPAFGHAADFSWIAGKVVVTKIQGGCTYIQYSQTGDRFVPTGDGWTQAEGAGLAQDGVAVVAFGHPAAPTDPVPVCGAPGYIVTSAQPNMQP